MRLHPKYKIFLIHYFFLSDVFDFLKKNKAKFTLTKSSGRGTWKVFHNFVHTWSDFDTFSAINGYANNIIEKAL